MWANPAHQPYPRDAHPRLGWSPKPSSPERAAMRETVASGIAAPGTSPESDP